ncbi:MAG TPA: hypothetical protein VJ742_12245 [Nitrososphaera sp.]|nr:hypothetical protein [Nitrososphaera sp.]
MPVVPNPPLPGGVTSPGTSSAIQENLLAKPRLRGLIRESPAYQVLGVGFTNVIFLLGHADGLALNSPYQVASIQEAVNLLGADAESPLVRGMLEAYYSGARDIFIVAVAPMSEYIDDVNDRLTLKPSLGGMNFYQRYYDRLVETYAILREWDFADFLVPLEASFYNTGDVNFVEQLVQHCSDSFALSGKIRFALLGTRGNITREAVTEMVFEDRLHQGNDGKFVSVIVGDGLINNKEIGVAYQGSVVPSVAGLLSALPLNRGITYLPIPNIVMPTHTDFRQAEIEALTNAKLNPVIRTTRGRRGERFKTVVATDNTLGADGTDYWSLVQLRLVATIIERIRTMGRRRIGTIEFGEFRMAVFEYMAKLQGDKVIRDYSASVTRHPDIPTTALVDVSVRPYFGIREIVASIEVGPSLGV